MREGGEGELLTGLQYAVLDTVLGKELMDSLNVARVPHYALAQVNN